jgi:hypothetical protein
MNLLPDLSSECPFMAVSRSLGSGFQRRLWEKHISGKEN